MSPSPAAKPRPRRYLRVGCLLIALAGMVAFFTPMYLGLREAFFSPPVELSGAGFDAAHLAHVAAESGIVFPLGTEGIEYCYKHGQDPYGFAKVAIPATKREAFLKRNAAGPPASGERLAETYYLAWWRPGRLRNLQQLSAKQGSSPVVHAYVGEEAGRLVVYVRWFYC